MKKSSLAVLVMMFSFFTGCGDSYLATIYDSDKLIASDTNTYNLSNYDQVVGDTTFYADVNQMDGMDTLWSIDSSEETTVDFNLALDVKNGKVKLVLISPTDELTTLAELSSKDSISESKQLKLPTGNNRIKIVSGNSAKFQISLAASAGEFYNLGFDN